MKKLIVLALFLSSACFGNAKLDKIVQRHIVEAWNDVSVATVNGEMKIHAYKMQIINDMAYVGIMTQVCQDISEGPFAYSYVKSVRVLNKYKKQGFILKPANKCESLFKGKDFVERLLMNSSEFPSHPIRP